MMKTEEKLCLQCNSPLVGRIDKKFCDDHCRSNYNNKANAQITAEMRAVNRILHKNRHLLHKLCHGEAKSKVSKTKLHEEGFNFKYHTHSYTTQKGSVYKLCYDYGYLPIENDYYMIVRWGKE